MSDFTIKKNNIPPILKALDNAKPPILEAIGIKAEKYAKARCPVGTPESTGKQGYRGGTLRNSITHQVDQSKNMVSIGTNVEYGPYVELGTGPYFVPPPSWEQFGSERGSGAGSGYVHPRPYLKPAIEDHITEYNNIIKKMLGG